MMIHKHLCTTMNDADVEDTLLLAMLVTDFANMIIKIQAFQSIFSFVSHTIEPCISGIIRFLIHLAAAAGSSAVYVLERPCEFSHAPH